MEKTYDPHKIEAHWSKQWEIEGYNKPKPADQAYCIMIPPPNVTGSLHMGHGFQVALMDCLIRYHRMRGDQTLWQVGTDHAGIATQMLVERRLEQQGVSRHELGREDFLKAIWDWKKQSGGTITKQLRHLGASVDWDRERFTMDEGLSDAVITLFIQLYRDKRIYRGQKLVNWDPQLQTAISDLEVINVEKQGHIWHIRYPITGSDAYLVVATTRPETLFGDSACAVHPDDPRYQHLIGKTVDLPFCNRTIPIIADTYVEMDFGSGCVKITPAHDFNDHEVGKRHNLPLHNVMTKKATMTNVPSAYEGLSREQARKKVIAELQEKNLLEATEPHTNTIPTGDRSGVAIEPYLTKQWFVACEELAKPAYDAVKNGDITFYPKNYENTYFRWLENIQDWCISRQLWWGHRIPAWYDEEDNIYVGKTEQDVRTYYGLDKSIFLKQDPDVLDTWFSSALWPFATLGWPEKTKDMQTYFPSQVLVTGHDIIFYWVARMIMMSLYCCKEIPFKHIYITGLIRDEHNHKMSKSKGNVIDPLDLVNGIDLEALLEKRTQGLMQPDQAQKIVKNTKKSYPEGIRPYGTDALRFTYCALASTGRDIRFDIQRLEGYRNFCNKLWNATRYVLGQVQNFPPPPHTEELSFSDHWIYQRLETTKMQCEKHITEYRFDLLAKTLYDFVWHDFCDWYIELSKPRLKTNQASVTEHTLLCVLEETVRMLHPIIPFITEAIWQELKPVMKLQGASIMISRYPEINHKRFQQNCDKPMQWLQTIVTSIRTMRAEMHISPAKKVPIYLCGSASVNADYTQLYGDLIQDLAKTSSLQWQTAPLSNEACARHITAYGTVFMPLKDLVDKEQEIARVQKQMQKIQKQLDKAQAKLKNTHYLDNAPKDIIAKELDQVNVWKDTLTNYEIHLQALERLS